MTTYVLAGGCFWCLDAVYRRINGVTSVISGYTGGTVVDPNYSQVSGGTTGHAEAVKVIFDETVVPADTILDIFFTTHNPTTLNRQGNDIGTQYRSAMFYADEEQKQMFEAAIQRAVSLWDEPIVTELAPLNDFYDAEAYHQDYFNNNPANPYCSVVIMPKITKARKNFTKWINKD
jgi:peptide-methionine (S)-S-oxide reductase